MIELIDRFVPVVDSPSNYTNAPQDRLQYRLVERVLTQTTYGQVTGAQGLYIITPSGRLLAGTTRHSDPEQVLAEMRRGLAEYARLSRLERLLASAPNAETDRVESPNVDDKPPEGGLILRMATRGLPDSGVDRTDTRHSAFYKLDRVWLTREQAKSFIPATLRVGEKTSVRGPGLAILLRLHLGVFVQPNPAWNAEDIREARFTSEITSVRGTLVEVDFSGDVRYEANNSYNRRRYSPKLLGRGTWDSKKQQFIEFDLLGVGMHTLGDAGEDRRSTGPKSIPLGVLFTLNGENHNDQVPPHYIRAYDWVAR